MPRRSSYSPTSVRDFCEQKIAPFFQDGYVDRNNFRVSNLEALRAFPDKAFKAFLARKVLQLPGSIAASVFNITTGLISQAEETEVTFSRSGQPRQPNAYSRASRDYMTSQGHFKVPGYDRVFRLRPAGLLDGEKKQLFKNFARLAIVQNRGADVVNFQIRLVASYMSEEDAIFFKNQTLPAWRILVARAMATDSSGASTPEATQPTAPSYIPESRRAGIVQMSTETTIQELIYRGTDRDTATAFVEKFNNLGLFVYVVDYTAEVESLTEVQLRLPSESSSVTAMPAEQEIRTAFSETRIGTLSSLRRVDDRDYLLKFDITGARRAAREQSEQASTSAVDPSRFSNQMTSLGYSDEFIARILEEFNSRGLVISDITLIDEVVYGPTETNSFVVSVRAGLRIGDFVMRQLQRRLTSLYEREGYVRSAYVTRDNDNTLEIRFYHTEVHEDDADVNVIEGVRRATGDSSAIELGNRFRSDYEGLAPYLRNIIPLGAYAKCRSFGWLHSNIAHWCRDFWGRNLKVLGASTYTGGSRDTAVRYMGLSVVETSDTATAIRPNTWLAILRDSLIGAQGPAEVRVMIAGASYIQPARFRRNPTRGNVYVPLIGIPEPLEYDLSESQHGETQPSTEATEDLSNIPEASQRALRVNGWTAAEVRRFARRLFLFGGTVVNVYRLGNTLKIEGRYSDTTDFFSSADGLRNAALVAINNRLRSGNADAGINRDTRVWSVEMRNINLLGTGEQSAQTDESQYQPQGSSYLRFVGYQVASPNRLFTSGELPFNWALAPIYNEQRSYLLYFWYETYGQFYYLSTGPLTITEPLTPSDSLWTKKRILELIPQDEPGKLKLYRDDSMQGGVANAVQSIIDGRNYAPAFTPVRRGENFDSMEFNIQNLEWADSQFFTNNQGRMDRLNFWAGSAQGATTSERVTDEQMRQVSEMSFTGTIGWEFEGEGGDKTHRELRNFLSANGINFSSTGGRYGAWDLKNDPSVRGSNTFEIASPVETGEEGIEDVLLCCRNLQKAGVLVNVSGGVHLHFGYRDWDLQHRKNILKNQITAENLFRATVPTYRREAHNRWANLLSGVSNIQNRIENATTLDELNGASGYGRYFFINTRTGDKPTWEWRYPTGTIEPDSTEMTIRLISKLIEISKFGLLHEDDCKPEGMKKWLGEEIGGFWINRMYELSTGSSSNQPTRTPSTIVRR